MVHVKLTTYFCYRLFISLHVFLFEFIGLAAIWWSLLCSEAGLVLHIWIVSTTLLRQLLLLALVSLFLILSLRSGLLWILHTAARVCTHSWLTWIALWILLHSIHWWLLLIGISLLRWVSLFVVWLRWCIGFWFCLCIIFWRLIISCLLGNPCSFFFTEQVRWFLWYLFTLLFTHLNYIISLLVKL